MTIPNVDEIANRPQRYWNVDGLPELVMGVLWIVWGLNSLLPEVLPKRWALLYAGAGPVVLVFSSFCACWVVKKLKAKFTFPRAGYVEWQKPRRAAMILPAVLAAAVTGFVIILIRRGQAAGLDELVTPAIGLVLAAAFLIAGARQKLGDFYLLAGASLGLSVILLPLRLGPGPGLGRFFLGIGCVAAVLGVFRLRRFVRDNPIPPGGEE